MSVGYHGFSSARLNGVSGNTAAISSSALNNTAWVMSGNVTSLSCSNGGGGDPRGYSYTEIYIEEAQQHLLNPAGQLLYIIISCPW